MKEEILKFGLEIIDLLMSDKRFSFGETDLRLYMDGLSANDKELSVFIADANKVYNNSEDGELHGNYLICEMKSGGGITEDVRFNLDMYFAEALKSDTLSVKEKIAQELLDQKSSSNVDELFSIDSYDALKHKLILRMLNFQRNSVRLKNAVYKRFGDAVLCAYINVSHGGEQFMSTKVTRDMLQEYGVTTEQLINDALLNTQKIYPERIFFNLDDSEDKMNEGYSAEEALKLIKSGKRSFEMPKKELLLTNSIHLNGAVAILYPGIAEAFSEIFGGGYYVDFISVHEVMLYPTNTITVQQVKNALIATNNRFNDDDVLSYNVYRYDVRRKQFKNV